MQSQQATSKVHRHSNGAEDSKQKPSLRLQAHTGVAPYSSSQHQGEKQFRVSVDAVPLQQSWYGSHGAAVVREAIKVSSRLQSRSVDLQAYIV